MTHLTRLVITSWDFYDVCAEHVARLPQLRELDIHWTRVSAKGLHHLAKGCTQLRRLRFTTASVMDETWIAAFVKMRYMERLTLSHAWMTDAVLLHLARVRSLAQLHLIKTQGFTVKGLAVLRRLKRHVDIVHAQFEG